MNPRRKSHRAQTIAPGCSEMLKDATRPVLQSMGGRLTKGVRKSMPRRVLHRTTGTGTTAI